MPPEEVTTETAEAPDSFQAFQEAIKQNSTEPAEQSAPAEEKTEGAEETGDTEASETDTTPEETEAADQGDETAEETLLTEEQLESLKKKSPEEQIKEFNRAFTQKTQRMAAERRQYEPLKPWLPVIDRYNQDPKGTVRAIAEQLGLQVVDPATGGTGQQTASAGQTDEISEELKSILGDELAFMAEPLTRAVEKLASKYVSSEIQPLKAAEQERAARQAAQKSAEALEQLTQKHPDWKQHEQKMLALAKKYAPGPEASELDYLELLYEKATAGRLAAAAQKKAIARITNAVKNAEPPLPGVSADKVTKTLPKGEGLSENDRLDVQLKAAFEAALRGEVLES